MNASVPSPESRPTDTALADVVARLRRAMRRAARAADPDGAYPSRNWSYCPVSPRIPAHAPANWPGC